MPTHSSKRDAVLGGQRLVDLAHRALHPQAGAHRALRVIAVRDGSAEDRHHVVADELVDISAVLEDLLAEASQNPLELALDRLRVEPLRDRRVAGEIREQDASRCGAHRASATARATLGSSAERRRSLRGRHARSALRIQLARRTPYRTAPPRAPAHRTIRSGARAPPRNSCRSAPRRGSLQDTPSRERSALISSREVDRGHRQRVSLIRGIPSTPSGLETCDGLRLRDTSTDDS